MKKFVVLIMAVAIGLFACKKDDENQKEGPGTNKVRNMPLAVGNYWVYEVFNVDSNGVSTTQNSFDTCRVTGTQTINGNTYYTIKNYPDIYGISTTLNLRDSVGYLVSPSNTKFYAEHNYTDILASAESDVPAYTVTSKMAWQDSTHSVPAGTYTQTGTFLSTINITEPNYPWPTTRYTFTTFAKDVGIIKRRYFYFNSPNYVELRLVDFHQEQ